MERKLTDQEKAKREQLVKMQQQGLDPFVINEFIPSHSSLAFKHEFNNFSKEQLHENHTEIKLVGRIMAIRQTFAQIQDNDGKIQIYINKKEQQEDFKIFNDFASVGDIIGVCGTPMKTNTGELTLKVVKFVILAKALKPLPEKWHGLQDDELRARQRYVDLIMNTESKTVFLVRSIILRELRNFFDNKGFLEVETPILHPQLGGAAARPFITHHNTLDRNYFLRVATELPLKKLIVGGFTKIYELGRNFRNEGMDAMHNPEFTTLEAYQAYVSVKQMMDLVEGVFHHLAQKLGKSKITYKGVELDFSKPFKRIDMTDFVKQKTGIDFATIKTDQEAIELAKKNKLEIKPHMHTKGHIINLFFEHFCEAECTQPTFVLGHPVEVSPLAKRDVNNPTKTERFELFICGKEYCNAFSELNNPIEQYERFSNQLKERELGNSEANDMDEDFINALEYGMPPTGGLGLGVDRIVMLFTNQTSIKDVLFFPHMKDENN